MSENFYIKNVSKNGTSLEVEWNDGIKSQFDVALPVLEDLKIKSFFFVYSSLFTKNPDFLEVYRYFRINYFKNIEDFYNLFFKKCDKDLNSFFNVNNNSDLLLSPPFTILIRLVSLSKVFILSL